MAFKFEIKDTNFLVVTDTTLTGAVESTVLDMPKADAYYDHRKLRFGRDRVYIYDKNEASTSGAKMFDNPIADCIDDNDVPFTKDSFVAWMRLNTGFSTASGGSGAWTGEVEFRADLPITLLTPAIGDVYLVQKPTKIGIGILSYTTYQSGLYIRDFDNGNLNDWRRLNVKVKFTDSEFSVVSAIDESKQIKFNVSPLSVSTVRTYTWQDKNYTVAGLDDIAAHGLPQVLSINNTTGLNDISIDDNQIIKATNGTATINLRNLGVDGQVDVSGDGIQLNAGQFFVSQAVSNISLGINGTSLSLFKGDLSKIGDISILYNDGLDVSTFNFDGYPVGISTKNATIKADVINSVASGGVNPIIKTDGANYINKIAYNTGLAGELIVEHTPNAADFTQTHQAKSGDIALISDILKQKAGTVLAVSFSGNPKRATVTFATPFADANYSVSLIDRTDANKNINPKIDAGATYTANGFTISLGVNNINNFVACDWVATKHGEN